MNGHVKFMSALVAFTLATGALVAPASARDSYVIDGAGLFKSATVSRLNSEIGDFHSTTGKEIVVVTEPSLDGKTLSDAVEATFAKQQVNGVLFYFAKAEKKDAVVGDRASKAFFPAGEFTNIHDAMRGYLRSGDPDQAIITGVGLVLDQYRSHERGLTTHSTVYRAPSTSSSTSSIGGGMSLFWLALILIAGFLIIRSIFRAMAGPRPMPPGYGPGMGGPGMGPPMGYGGGYGPGYGGGGGGFFSGLLGGLGGAWLGNELFGGNRGTTIIEQGGNQSGVVGDGGVGGGDSAGWQSDAGQADMGGMGGGSWGDSGGGFDSGGGGFGDGGGGGDSGGGW
jgi:hypothetical protein